MRLIKDNVERIADSQERINALIREGFRPLEVQAIESSDDRQKALVDMTAVQLRALAKEKGLEGCESLKKEELLTALKDVV